MISNDDNQKINTGSLPTEKYSTAGKASQQGTSEA